MEQKIYLCDICGVEVKPQITEESNHKIKVLLELWEVSITKVSPENVSLSQHFKGDAQEGKSGQVCKACLNEWYPLMKCKQPTIEGVKH